MRFAVIVSFALISSAAQAQSSAEASVRRVDSLWAQMYAKQDTVLALAIYDPKLVFTSANGALKTREQEMADVRPTPGLVMSYFRTNVERVVVRGDTADVTGSAEWKFTWNGSDRTVKRTYSMTHLRGGTHGWRIVAVRMGNAP
jgi:ketosteroid isomerase-like protein